MVRLSSDLIVRLQELVNEDEATQQELAEGAVINPVTLGQWLRGHRVATTPRAQQAVRRLCRRVGIKPERGLEPLALNQSQVDA